jgi:hypothetical protein
MPAQRTLRPKTRKIKIKTTIITGSFIRLAAKQQQAFNFFI